MQRFDKLISDKSVQYIFNLYHNLSNQVDIDGQTVDRHAPSAIGHFMLSKFTAEEFDPVWQEVQQQIGGYDLVYARVLKYNRGCGIMPHKDSYKQGQLESDMSLIIQLNDPDSYAGGMPTVNGEAIYLNQHDAVMYSYDEEHGVSQVRKGIRYVVNLRLKKVK